MLIWRRLRVDLAGERAHGRIKNQGRINIPTLDVASTRRVCDFCVEYLAKALEHLNSSGGLHYSQLFSVSTFLLQCTPTTYW